MSLRPLTRDDADAALDVWNRAAKFDPISSQLLAEKIWGDPDFRPDLAFAFDVTGRLAGFAVGLLRQPAGEPCGYVKLIGVDPPHQGQGMGGELLCRLEGELARLGAREIRIAESAPNYLTPGVDQRDSDACRFFQRRGYEQFAESRNLHVDLTADDYDSEAAKRELAAQAIAIRRATAGDRPALTAFLDAHWPTWKPETFRSFANRPISLHIAVKDDAVIGFANYHGNNVGTGWFGPMGTDPAYRQQGVGAVLLRRCLRDLKDQGLDSAIIAWAANIDFYQRHAGARVDRVFCRYRKLG
jgi:GNAT superfamily N-acetyltransferase